MSTLSGKELNSDKFMLDLNNRVLVKNLYIWENDELCKRAVSIDGSYLKYVRNQTDEICKLAVSQTGTALYFVKTQTDEICKIAVKQNGIALLHVRVKTDEICKLAAKERAGQLSN